MPTDLTEARRKAKERSEAAQARVLAIVAFSGAGAAIGVLLVKIFGGE